MKGLDENEKKRRAKGVQRGLEKRLQFFIGLWFVEQVERWCCSLVRGRAAGGYPTKGSRYHCSPSFLLSSAVQLSTPVMSLALAKLCLGREFVAVGAKCSARVGGGRTNNSSHSTGPIRTKKG